MPKKKENVINFPSAPSKLERQIEAILFAASEPLDIETIEKRLQTNSNIKKNLEKITDWQNINELIPKFYFNNEMSKTGIAGIFTASLELTKEGLVKVSQKKLFDNIMIKKS